MQAKTTRAFRTISEAGDELGLQPHVLRFWESKFPEIKPIKRGGGRRFYRPEDIEFLRGIKILLHNEKHPIKDIQKLIRVKGANSVIELGQSIERASEEKKVAETVLIPERLRTAKPRSRPLKIRPVNAQDIERVVSNPKDPTLEQKEEADLELKEELVKHDAPEVRHASLTNTDRENLENALTRLTALRSRWTLFKNNTQST